VLVRKIRPTTALDAREWHEHDRNETGSYYERTKNSTKESPWTEESPSHLAHPRPRARSLSWR